MQTACMQSLFPAAVFLAVGSKRKWKHLLTYIRHIGAIGGKTKDRRATRSFRFFMPTYFPRASRFIPRPVSARALTPPEPRTTSRIYPASIRRSRCSSEMVRCIGLLPTSVKDANSSLVSRVSRKEKEDKRLSTMTLDFRVKVLGFADKSAASWACKTTEA